MKRYNLKTDNYKKIGYLKNNVSKKQSDFKEKAEKDNLRLLEKICNKMDFHMVLLGNIYCSLKTNEKIYCRFRAQKKDHNGLYPCLNQRWYPNNPGAYH